MPYPQLPQGNPAPDLNLGSVMSLRNALNAAANQQAIRDRQNKNDAIAREQRDFENRLQMETKGALEIQGPAPFDSTGGARPSLLTPSGADPAQSSDPATHGRGTVIQIPDGTGKPGRGKQYYIPTKGEKDEAELNDTNSFIPKGQLAATLAQFGMKKDQRITPAHAHSLLLAINLAQGDDGEPFDIDTSGKFHDAQGNPTPVTIGRKTGKVRLLDLSGAGAQRGAPPSTPGAAPGGPFDIAGAESGTGPQPAQPSAAPASPFGFKLPDKDKPDVSQVLPGREGPNGGLLIYDKNTQSTKEIDIPKGSKRTMTPGQEEADKDRHLRSAEIGEARDRRRTDAQQKITDKFSADHDKAQGLEQTQWGVRGLIGDAMEVKSGGEYQVPRVVNGQIVLGPPKVMPDDADKREQVLKTLKVLANAAKIQAERYQGEAKRLRKRLGAGEFAPAEAGAKPKADPLGIR